MSTVTSLTSYDKDFAQWAFDTAQAIRERRFEDIDWDNVAEEIESLGRTEHRELVSRLAQLMYHVLKMEYQPERRTRSWERTIRVQRRDIYRVLEEEPSLKAYLREPGTLARAYDGVLPLGTGENLPDSVLDRFPDACPYTIETLLPDLDQK